eukprot:gene32103-38822_t
MTKKQRSQGATVAAGEVNAREPETPFCSYCYGSDSSRRNFYLIVPSRLATTMSPAMLPPRT